MTENEARPTLDELYQRAATTFSDIHEHIPTLFRLARMVEHVTEFGTRSGISTAALLHARPRRLITYDIVRTAEVDDLIAAGRRAGIDCEFRQENVLEATIEPTDFLFIDTLHTYEQTRGELARHAEKVRRFIAFHDTTTYGEYGETPGSVGIWPAIREYFDPRPEWKLIDEWMNCHGFTLYMRRW